MIGRASLNIRAGVAESADALASGASLRKEVWVQVPSPAPKNIKSKGSKFRVFICINNKIFCYRVKIKCQKNRIKVLLHMTYM